jgi:hypothetical protein
MGAAPADMACIACSAAMHLARRARLDATDGVAAPRKQLQAAAR